MADDGVAIDKGVGGVKKKDVFSLGSNDNPGNLITPVQLKGDNYDEWARAIRTALKAKRKFGFLDGTILIPNDEEKLEDWYTVHSMLVAWLMNTIDPSLRSNLSYYDDARELWTVLKERFCVVNGTRICQLKASLGECKQGKTETIASYFSRLSKIFDDLTNYIILPTCTCDGCKCKLAAQYSKLSQEERLHWFLIGLDSAYGSIRSNLLTQDPLPSLDRAYKTLIQEERLPSGTFHHENNERDSVMAFKLKTDIHSKSHSVDNSDKFCVHCNRQGHDQNSCFQLHGFPDWWGDRPRGVRGPGRGGRGGGRNGAASGRSGRSGGNSENQSVRANKTTTMSSGQSNISQALPNTSEAAGLSGITPTQWQSILDLLNLQKPKDRLSGPSNEEVDWSG
ncbi:unnamed protein product [Rhodiola kirilowii]